MKSADVKSRKRFSFEISTDEKMYLLYADSEKEKDDWIGAVGKSIVRSSRTYLDQGKNSHGHGNSNGQGRGQGQGSSSGNRNSGQGNERKSTMGYGYSYDDDDEDDDDDGDYGADGGVFENEKNHPYFND